VEVAEEGRRSVESAVVAEEAGVGEDAAFVVHNLFSFGAAFYEKSRVVFSCFVFIFPSHILYRSFLKLSIWIFLLFL